MKNTIVLNEIEIYEAVKHWLAREKKIVVRDNDKFLIVAVPADRNEAPEFSIHITQAD